MECVWFDHFTRGRAKLGHPIVKVHQRVNEVINDGKVDSCGRSNRVSIPAERKYCDMMIPMKKNQFPFGHQNEKGI